MTTDAIGAPLEESRASLAWFERLGPRALRRATPRLGPILGGVGATLLFFGLLTLATDASDLGSGEGDSNKMIGMLMCAIGTAAGYSLMVRFRAGALATFGSVVAVLLYPFIFFFLTFDEAKSPPFSIDVVLLFAVAGWTTAYLTGASRGRPVFLAAAAVGLWLFMLEQVESAFTTPFSLLPMATPVDEFVETGSASPDVGTIGFVCVIFAAGYLALAYALDRRGLKGMVTPLLGVGFVALYTGFVTIQEDLERAGAGALLAAAGVGILFVSTRLDRRGSAWLGGAAIAVGLLWIVGDAFEDADSVIAPAITLMVIGAAVGFAGDRWARALAEPSELARPVPEADQSTDAGTPSDNPSLPDA